MDDREPKLPKWAQHEMCRLRRDIASLENRVEQLRGEPGGSETAFARVFSGPGSADVYKSVPLQSDTVLFKLPDGSEIEVRVNDRGLYVYHPGGNVLSVRPVAANVVTVRAVRP